ncbi:hypothetical protein GCM10011338_41620 [Alteromonas lipolytica]|nr:hypothetical protein GCM10011338_41620 [Alteromonas lipolytica]
MQKTLKTRNRSGVSVTEYVSLPPESLMQNYKYTHERKYSMAYINWFKQ